MTDDETTELRGMPISASPQLVPEETAPDLDISAFDNLVEEIGREGTLQHVEKLKSRNDYCNISYSMHESLARIGSVIGASRRTLRLANPGPSVGGLTGEPGSCWKQIGQPRNASLVGWFHGTYLPRTSLPFRARNSWPCIIEIV